jgi:hypothetical protein
MGCPHTSFVPDGAVVLNVTRSHPHHPPMGPLRRDRSRCSLLCALLFPCARSEHHCDTTEYDTGGRGAGGGVVVRARTGCARVCRCACVCTCVCVHACVFGGRCGAIARRRGRGGGRLGRWRPTCYISGEDPRTTLPGTYNSPDDGPSAGQPLAFAFAFGFAAAFAAAAARRPISCISTSSLAPCMRCERRFCFSFSNFASFLTRVRCC